MYHQASDTELTHLWSENVSPGHWLLAHTCGQSHFEVSDGQHQPPGPKSNVEVAGEIAQWLGICLEYG